MRAKKRTGKGSKTPLPGHTRIKQRMVPDFLLKIPMSFTRYEDDVLPEIIGIAILNDAHGYQRGAELSLALARQLKGLGRLGSPFLSAFEDLTLKEVKQLKEALGSADCLLDISKAFTPIIRAIGPTPLISLKLTRSSRMTSVCTT